MEENLLHLSFNKEYMPMEWFTMALHKYLDFSSRSRRKEFWMFYLFYSIFSALLGVIDNLFDLFSGNFGFLSTIFSVLMFIPYLAVSIRRLHDVNKSGWFLLLILVPIIGWIWLFILLITEGYQGPNEYGDDPKKPYNELDDIGIS
ncbi:DUF805 domain-containing protein [Aquimarina agarivorans]|uniref:DUF805 domain-containing protein n=1 Tax=Aquimarina agarivorans TaxID=980584 RepID=UPI000248EDD3|nr:DUF805 domain-containing protein [Aquimarina agarivorans]